MEQLHILLVEDNPGDADYICEILPQTFERTYSFTKTETLQAAISVIEQAKLLEKAIVDVILLDLNLPDSNGLTTIKKLRQVTPHTPIVVLTGVSDRETSLSALHYGAQDYLEKGNITGLLVSRVIDYSIERIKIQLEQQDTELKYQTILNTQSNRVVFLDTAMKVIWANLAAYKEIDPILQEHFQTQEDIRGYNCQELWNSGSQDCTDCPVKRALNLGLKQSSLKQLPNGKTYLLTGNPVHNSQGEIIGIVQVAEDYSERLLIEDQLRQSQKMEAVGQLAGGVAHDFNNLLQAILGYNQLMLESGAFEQPYISYLKEIQSCTKHGANLTRQLLTFSRHQMLKLEYIPVDKTIEDLMKILGRIIGEHIKLILKPGIQNGFIYADKGQLEQILINLAVNARDAMEQGGTLTIETFAEPENKIAHIKVSDTGTGIDPRIIPKIFDPFFTTKEEGKGTGLGLSTVYGIVNQHEGKITLSSIVGNGTTFDITLPLYSYKNLEHIQSTVSETKGDNETILIVEDENSIRTIMSSVLKHAGYCVFTSKNGIEALNICETFDKPIDLIILDMIMPEMGGAEFYSIFKEKQKTNHCSTKVIIASGYSTDSAALKMVEIEHIPFLQKPFTPQELLTQVRKLLDN